MKPARCPAAPAGQPAGAPPWSPRRRQAGPPAARPAPARAMNWLEDADLFDVRGPAHHGTWRPGQALGRPRGEGRRSGRPPVCRIGRGRRAGPALRLADGRRRRGGGFPLGLELSRPARALSQQRDQALSRGLLGWRVVIRLLLGAIGDGTRRRSLELGRRIHLPFHPRLGTVLLGGDVVGRAPGGLQGQFGSPPISPPMARDSNRAAWSGKRLATISAVRCSAASRRWSEAVVRTACRGRAGPGVPDAVTGRGALETSGSRPAPGSGWRAGRVSAVQGESPRRAGSTRLSARVPMERSACFCCRVRCHAIRQIKSPMLSWSRLHLGPGLRVERKAVVNQGDLLN